MPAGLGSLFEHVDAVQVGRRAAALGVRAGLRAPHHAERLLVRFKPGATQHAKQSAHRAFRGAKVLHTYRRQAGLELIEVPDGKVREALAAYRRNPNVEYAEPDLVITISRTPNDPDFGLLWGLHNEGQTVGGDPGIAGADIGAVEAWDIWTGDPTFRVAVIDTGVDYTHPDLVDNIWTNPGETGTDEFGNPKETNGIDDDFNGYIDDVHGFNFVTFSSDPMDDHGHGTHVSGTIGAVADNGIGVAGVNWRCQIVGLKFLNANGSGTVSGAVGAIEYVIANGIRLSNNSWGGTGYSQSLYNAILDAQSVGHVFVAAAGNTGADSDLLPHYPSAYDLGNIISVAATDNDDDLASFSVYGAVSVDLAAPGVKIYSTIPGASYTYLKGTSMASPHVTGVLALLMSRLPTLGWHEVRDLVIGTTRPVAALSGKTVSGGVINAAAAVGDCNQNGVPDDQDIAAGTSGDCGANGVPDECEGDCNNNGSADTCDLFLGTSFDCTSNGVLDECEPDCNNNGRADSCELADGFEEDCNRNGVPDSCEPDCNANGVADACDIWFGTSEDCTEDGIPDECEPDCNNNLRADSCDIDAGSSSDCNGNDVPDECDLSSGTSDDCSGNGVPDECEYDCDDNGRADSCDIADGLLPDTNGDGVADICELGMRLVPVEASGPHTVEGNQIFLPVGGQRVTLELRLSGWDTDSDYSPLLRVYQSAVDATTFSNGMSGSLTYARIPCTSNSQCRRAWNNPGDTCIDGFCDVASAIFVDMPHPDFIFRDNGAVGATFLNIGLAPLVGGVIIDESAPPPDTGKPRYGATVLLDVPENAEGTFVVSLYPEHTEAMHTFWGPNIWTTMPIPALAPAIITLPADCNLNGVEDAQDIADGTSDDCNENGVPDECIEREADCNGNLQPDECDIADHTSLDVNQNSVPDECEPSIIFVDAAAADEGNGRSWPDAFTDLQDALDLASASAGAVDEIWVAAGTYRPSRRAGPDEERTDTFQLITGVAIYGGFAGGETEREQRNPDANVTVMSGDIAGDDGPNFSNNGENAYQVVRGDDVDDSAILDGFTVTGGNADGGYWGVLRLGWGGGMYTADGSPTVSNCVFRDNMAQYGGGLAVRGGSPSFHHCLLTNNDATSIAGGAYIEDSANPSFTHCSFVGNTSWLVGGLSIENADEATLTNCLVIGNVAEAIGGIWSEAPTTNEDAITKVINCTIAYNRATDWVHGAGLQHSSLAGSVHVSNSILWGNEGAGDTRERFQLWVGPSAVLHHNCIQGWTGEYEGVGNIGDDPLFVDPLGPDGLTGTADDDLRLLPDSPAANTGDNNAVPASLTLDLDGNPRIFNAVVDIGAYEQIDCNGNGIPDWDDVGSGGSVDCDGNGIPDECEPDCNVNGVVDACDITGGVSADCDENGIPDECEPDCNLNGVTDACDVADGTSPDCNANLVPDQCDIAEGSSDDCDNDGLPDECTFADVDCNENGQRDACDIITGASGDCDANGVPDDCEDCNGNGRADSCDLEDGSSSDHNDNGVLDECDQIVYVDAAANGAGDGTTWANAFTDLQDALALAADPLIAVTEIWVAEGDYTPDRATGAAILSFELSDGISLFGGFAGEEARFSDRSPADNPTVLTGDLAGDDALGSLDWVAFRACRSDEGVPHPPGCQDFDVDDDGDVDVWDEVLALRIIDNTYHVVHVPVEVSGCLLDGFTVRGGNALTDYPSEGGGLLNEGGVTIRNCTFQANWALTGGGVVNNWAATELIATDCIFRGNHADLGGGGLASLSMLGFEWLFGVTEISGCIFDGNTAVLGGGAMINQSAIVSDSLFVDNWAKEYGGGLHSFASPLVVNTIFDGNSAGSRGGAVFNKESSAVYTNCVFRGNSASHGGAAWLEESDVTYVNCAFTGNVAVVRGGALQIFKNSNPSLFNCTLTGNSAINGGAVNYADSVGGENGVTIANSILWGNTGSGDDQTAQIYPSSSGAHINHSCVQGWTGSLGGVGNTGEDPLLVDADGPDDIFGTEDDDPQLDDGSPCIDAGDNTAVPADAMDFDGDDDTAEPVSFDAAGSKRFLDDLFTIDTGVGTPPIVDMGAYEYGDDCNDNDISDDQDIAAGTSIDCSGNGIPDECEPDCNLNGLADSCDIVETTASDCNTNGVPDECDIAAGRSVDCNDNGAPDTCDIAASTSQDCTENGVPDECDITIGRNDDCNDNGVPDTCDVAAGRSQDCTGNGLPDECEPDCNSNGAADTCDLANETSADCTENGIPDECDIAEGRNDDCDDNGIPDVCEFADCNANGALDICDIRDGTSVDVDGDDMPDECCVALAIQADTLSPRNRYLSFGTIVGPPFAVRVTLVDLPVPFDVLNGTTMWVGQPSTICENSGQSLEMQTPEGCGPAPGLSPGTFWSATLQCQPYYTDWSAQGTVHVYHRAVVPGGTYALQTINEGCGLTFDGNYSTALTMAQGRWGDVCGPGPEGACSGPPDGTVDVTNDVLGVLGKFANTLALRKASADVGPATPDNKVDVANDVLLTIAAFGGAPYPFAPDDPCNPG